jgi:hypothetical protein
MAQQVDPHVRDVSTAAIWLARSKPAEALVAVADLLVENRLVIKVQTSRATAR